ncbi:MAG: hypothetical protein R2821_01170 [Flavobacteriaceae bacterium]|jgi:heme A synthase
MIKMVHSYWAYLVLALLIVSFVTALIGTMQNKRFTDKNLRIFLFTLITSHIQLIIGFIAYYLSAFYETMRAVGMGEIMKMKEARLLMVEHPLMMIIAIVLITIGWSKHKKQTTDKGKFKTIAIFYGIALLLVLSRIPWTQWFAQ